MWKIEAFSDDQHFAMPLERAADYRSILQVLARLGIIAPQCQ
jgi:hypothetical protein